MELSERIRTERPRAEVFAAWSCLDRAHEYPGVVSERRRPTRGPIGVRSRFRAVDRWPGRTVESIIEISAYQPPERIAGTWSDPILGGWDAIFEEVEGGTELHLHATLAPSGARSLLLPLLRPWIGRQTRRSMRAFKACIESGQAASRR